MMRMWQDDDDHGDLHSTVQWFATRLFGTEMHSTLVMTMMVMSMMTMISMLMMMMTMRTFIPQWCATRLSGIELIPTQSTPSPENIFSSGEMSTW